MKKSQLVRIINETILDMLKEGDQKLIKMMMNHDRRLDGRKVNEAKYVQHTIKVISESLGMKAPALRQKKTLVTPERQKMIRLSSLKETSNRKVVRKAAPKTTSRPRVASKSRGR